jgi:hypothetical protein
MIPDVLEFMGVLLICATTMLTHNNPYFIGLAYTSAMLIAHQSIVHFNPLFVLLNFALGRLSLYESLKLLVIQTTAVLAFIIAYQASK